MLRHFPLLAVAVPMLVACAGNLREYPAWMRAWADAVRPERSVHSDQRAESEAHRLPVEIQRKADGQHMVLIPSGTFLMGRKRPYSPNPISVSGGPGDGPFNGYPQRRVTLTRPYYMDVQEVSVGQWNDFCAATGREEWTITHAASDTLPATRVLWSEARVYCQWVGCDLPTEAQWERAARGGIEGEESCPDAPGDRDIRPRSRTGLYAVGSTDRNPYGLRGMCANAGEWCLDRFDHYEMGAQVDPMGPEEGIGRAVRGLRHVVGRRDLAMPDKRYGFAGFRCARVVPPDE